MKRFFTIALLGATLSGCVSAPSTTPRERALAESAVGLGTAPMPAVASDWWTQFSDPELDRLVGEALHGNPSLAAALARMRMAEAQLSADRAQTYPQISFDAQETRERFSKTYIIPPPFNGTTQWIGTIQANLSWNIDLWGREAAMVARARDTARAAQLDAAGARLALAGAVTQAYIGLDRADRLADIAADDVKDRQTLLALTRTRIKNGLENEAALAQAQALLAEARQAKSRADANRDLIVHEIAALVGRGADAYGEISRPSLHLAALPALPKSLPADLLARRPDILAAEARVDAAVAGRKVARTAFYPDINLVGLAGWAAIGTGSLFTNSSLNYGAGPAIHLPLFDAGRLRADYAGATAGLDEAVADYNGAVLNAVKQAADRLTQLRALSVQAAEQQTALAAARKNLRIAETRYRNGLAPQLDVLAAENILLQARQTGVGLDADAASARVALTVALGGGFDTARHHSAQISARADTAAAQ